MKKLGAALAYGVALAGALAVTLLIPAEAGLVNMNGPVYSASSSSSSSSSGGGEPQFFDDFSSGDLSHSENGISYYNRPGVTVVTNGPIQNRHNARFRFGPDAAGEDSDAELAWDSDTWSTDDIYFGYYWHVPANYCHRNDGASNNKGFGYTWDIGGFAMYGTSDVAMGTNLFDNGDCTSKASHYLFGAEPGADEHQGPSTYPQYFPEGSDIITADDFGECLKIVVNHRYATQAAPSSDGVARVWKQRVNCTTLAAESVWYLLLDIDDGDWYVPGAPGFGTGYIHGWANSGFTEQTDYHVADFWIADFPYWNPEE
jgi:hypothetical protein